MLFLHTALCSAQETVNVLIAPEFQAPACTQPEIDFAVSPRSTLGIIPGSCNANRSSGLTGPLANESNQFDRLAFDWIYSPKGAYKDGFWFGALTGVEHDNFSTTAGSSADVYFFANALVTGYQWFWKNGFNIRLSFTAAHLTRISIDNYKVAPTENSDTINWLNTNASSQTHYAYGPAFGWAF